MNILQSDYTLPHAIQPRRLIKVTSGWTASGFFPAPLPTSHAGIDLPAPP